MTLTEAEKAQKAADKDTLEDVKKYAEARFITSIVNYMDSRPRTQGLHVSNLVYPSLRKGYFEYLDQLKGESGKNSAGSTEEKLLTLFIGQKFHEEPLTTNHELEMEYKIIGAPSVHGTLDDAVMTRSRVIIIDKKTQKTTKKFGLPDYAKQNHVAQVEFYAAMLRAAKFIASCKQCNRSWLLNFKPETCNVCGTAGILTVSDAPSFEGREFFGVVVYIGVGETREIKGISFKIDVEKATMYLNEKLIALGKALETGVPPPSVYGWWDEYSPKFYIASRMLDAGEANWRDYLPFNPSEKLNEVKKSE